MSREKFPQTVGEWVYAEEKAPEHDGWYRALFGEDPEYPDCEIAEENIYYIHEELYMRGEWYNEPGEFLIAYDPATLEPIGPP